MAKKQPQQAEEVSDDNAQIGTNNDARVAMLEQIASQNDNLMVDDFANVNDDGTTEAFSVRSPDGQEQPLTDEIVQDLQANETIEQLAQESSPPQRHKIRVNGKDLELSTEELYARAQKIEAADQYLAEAARIRNEALRKPSQPDVSEQQSVDDDLAIARAIQMGTEEEAVAALRSLRQSNKTLSPEDISRTIDERLTFNQAISKFRTEYADIVGDPYLNKLALDADNKMIANGDNRPYFERYREIGDGLRNWTASIVNRNAPPPPAQQDTRLARKAAAPVAPRAQSQKTQSSVENETEESTSEVIANIAKNRGGPQWMRA